MPWARAEYGDVRQQIKPGDVIAFGGKGGFAGVIKWATLGDVNHVAVVLPPDPQGEDEPAAGVARQPLQSIRIIESTSALDSFPGVNIRPLEERIDGHRGEVWWLPLSEATRRKLDLAKFHRFLHQQLGKGYDSVQAFKSAPDVAEDAPLVGWLTHSREDFSRFFCSELVAAGLEVGGAIGSLNASEVTPMDLCAFSLYQPVYHQLKGDRKLIKGYNTVDPEGWGELREPASFREMLYRYPALLGLIISGLLLLVLFIQEIVLGRLPLLFGPMGSLRDLRLAIIHCLLVGYFPSACLYLWRGMRQTAAELETILKPAAGGADVGSALQMGDGDPLVPTASIGTGVLVISGLMGLLLSVLMPLLTAETAAWAPSTWSPEIWWHRLLGLFIGWWAGWFVLSIWYTSKQTSRLAVRIERLDLFDLSPLSPFVKQGLLTSLLAVGALSLMSLFLLEPGQWPVVAITVGLCLPLAVLGLLLPVRGAHLRIREAKEAELAWTRERIRQASSFVYKLSAPESPGQLADLVAYRQFIQDVPDWPIEGSALLQVTLYLAVPVVSWFGNLLVGKVLGFLFG
jgi:hypothetical protein